MNTATRYNKLQCFECKTEYDIHAAHNFCKACSQPLVPAYDLSVCTPEDIINYADQSMWRYKKMLPVFDDNNIVSMGEGWTKIKPLHALGKQLGVPTLKFKEESDNPTASFKARGMSAAVSKGKELGLSQYCTPTAGNAGSALAAYSAKAGAKAHIYMPKATPDTFRKDCTVMGARVVDVEGSIRDAGMAMSKDNDGSWWDVSTMKEPFRLEGKKTLGYEIAEQYNYNLPDVIIYPTGGGTGLIGMWKAFHEMLTMGWIKHIPTRMVAVQMLGCDPIVQAFEKGADVSEVYDNPAPLIANGLRVPKAFADKMIMQALYNSNGYAIRINEDEMKTSLKQLAKAEGILFSPEGAALVSALEKLKASNWINEKDEVLLINTGSPYKYLENFELGDLG